MQRMPRMPHQPQQSNEEQLSGILRFVHYHRDGFLIGRLDSGFAIKGSMLHPVIGTKYTLTGKFVTHPKYGKQFDFSAYSAALPTSPEAIRAYIDEHAKWIGPVVARALVERYGEATLQTLKNSPEEVAAEISGITPERAQEISTMLKQNESEEASEISLRDSLGGVVVGKNIFRRILSTYGSDAASVVRDDPYRLARDIDGISFPIADRIARKHKIPEDAPERIIAGVRHVLTEASTQNGHTFLPLTEAMSEARMLLDLPRAIIVEGVREGTSEFIVDEAEKEIALRSLRVQEAEIAEKIVALNEAVEEIVPVSIDGLADDQIEAVEAALRYGVFVLTGAAGTGKTTTIQKIIENFTAADVALCAPSGKAARRIAELTARPAQTIHALLGAVPSQSGGFVFSQHAENPLPHRLTVVDETSMVDVPTFHALLDAVQQGTRLILIGDSYQLPSVGPGNILKDLIASGVVASKELTKIKRQNPGLIIINGQRVKDGIDILTEPEMAGQRDFHFIEADRMLDCQQEVLDTVLMYAKALDQPLRGIQVLSPLREKTIISVKSLNLKLRDELNKKNRPPNHDPDGPFAFWVGDKVIQTKNDYQLGVMNGDIGFVEEVDFRENRIRVQFDEPPRVVEIPLADNRLDLAYAITVHKFQGSQAQIVIVVAHSGLGPLIQTRPYFYTAITRAQKLCVVIGERDEVRKIIARNRAAGRWTKLKAFLGKEASAEAEGQVEITDEEGSEWNEHDEYETETECDYE